jgi:uroporphyrinogen-III decarboxylase
MTERERLLKVLKGEKSDSMPWYADLSYLYNSMEIRGTLEDKYKGEIGYLNFYKDLGAGICFYPPFVWNAHLDSRISFRELKDKDFHECVYDTPLGSIRSVQKYSSSTYSWAYQEHFVKNMNDLRVMLYIFQNTRYTENYKEFSRIDELWGEHGIATGIAPISVAPLQKLLARWAGVENTIDLYMDDPEEFEEILNRLQETEDEVFEILCDSPAVYVEFAENLSSEITGKTFFEKYNMPYYKKRIGQLHKAGKFVGIHIDGTLSSCLPLLEPCGFDVAEAVTPFPVGDIKLEDLRKTAGDNIVIWGGLPGALFSPSYSDELFREHLANVINVFQNDTRFVMGVADQVPPDGLEDRIKLVREMVEQG